MPLARLACLLSLWVSASVAWGQTYLHVGMVMDQTFPVGSATINFSTLNQTVIWATSAPIPGTTFPAGAYTFVDWTTNGSPSNYADVQLGLSYSSNAACSAPVPIADSEGQGAGLRECSAIGEDIHESVEVVVEPIARLQQRHSGIGCSGMGCSGIGRSRIGRSRIGCSGVE